MPITRSPVLRLKIPQFAHHSIAFSPFFEDRLAIASGANFGLVGNGRVHILRLGQGGLNVVKWYDTQDCVYDVAWNESHENLVIAACGNGSLRMFDTTLEGLPVRAWHEHKAEVMSVEWNNLQKDTFATASWDQTVKILIQACDAQWKTARATSLVTLPAHSGQVFCAAWSPTSAELLATCGQDGFLKVFDIRTPANRAAHQIRVSETDVLHCDWNKYDPIIATAGKDGLITLYDIRDTARPVGYLRGHKLAVRKVAWSPHRSDLLASASYDMTSRVWHTQPPAELRLHQEHTEFVMGCAWALFDQGVLADCAWDDDVHIYRI